MKKKIHNKKHAKYKHAQLIALVIIISIALIFTLMLNLSKPIKDVKTLNYTMNISDYVGINLDTDKLHFGTISPGGDSSRKLTINSNIEGYVFVTSSDADFIYIDKQGIKITNETAQMEFFAKVPKNTTPQNIEGTLNFYVLKNKHPWPLTFQKEKLLKIQTNKQSQPRISLNIAK